MTTPLAETVTRRTSLVVDEREVEVSLESDAADTPYVSFHLVGLHEKSDKRIPLLLLLRMAGYKVKLPKTDSGDVFDAVLRGRRVDPLDFERACAELEAALCKTTEPGSDLV